MAAIHPIEKLAFTTPELRARFAWRLSDNPAFRLLAFERSADLTVRSSRTALDELSLPGSSSLFLNNLPFRTNNFLNSQLFFVLHFSCVYKQIALFFKQLFLMLQTNIPIVQTICFVLGTIIPAYPRSSLHPSMMNGGVVEVDGDGLPEWSGWPASASALIQIALTCTRCLDLRHVARNVS